MNSNIYNAGGAPAARPASYFNGGAKEGAGKLREKITFDPPRVPVILRPEHVPTRPVEGRTGPQFRWEFEGNQVAWFDPDVHAEICACLEVSGCNEIAITKHVKRGQQPRFEVQGVDDQTREPARPAPAATAARRIDEITRSQAKPSRVWPTEENSERETAPPCNEMSEALMEATLAVHEVSAITGAHGMSIAWRAEDIRALAITIYIAKNGGRK